MTFLTAFTHHMTSKCIQENFNTIGRLMRIEMGGGGEHGGIVLGGEEKRGVRSARRRQGHILGMGRRSLLTVHVTVEADRRLKVRIAGSSHSVCNVSIRECASCVLSKLFEEESAVLLQSFKVSLVSCFGNATSNRNND